MRGDDLSTLFHPLSINEFVSRYWETEPLYLASAGRQSFEHIIKIKEIDAFLSRSDIRHPSLRLVKGGVELPLESYTREFRLGSHLSHDLVVNDKIFAEYHRGATIVLQQLQQSIPGFAPVSNAFEDVFGCNVHASAFITPPSAQGFTAHYDTHSFVALQLWGSKRWNLYDKTELPPIREDRETERPWTRVDPTSQLTLRAGDLLYVPRGTFHDAETSDEPSIHMTIGFFPPNWIDVGRAALAGASSQEPLRQSIPVARDLDNPDPLVVALLNNLDLLGAVRRLRSGNEAKRTDVRTGRLLDALSEDDWSESTRLHLHSHLAFKIEPDGQERVAIVFQGKRVSLPKGAEPALKEIISRRSFSLSDLGTNLDQASALILCRRLMREGFLTGSHEGGGH